MCMYMYICISIYVYTYIHTHIHIPHKTRLGKCLSRLTDGGANPTY